MSKILRMMLISAVIIFAMAAAVAAQVPDGARERAIEFLNQDWERKIADGRSFFDLEDIEGDLSNPELGDGFIVYKLNYESMIEYVSSDIADPTVFATLTDYYFPTFVNDQYIGSIMIIRNRDSKGDKRDITDGEYTFMGFTSRRNPNELKAIELQEIFPVDEGNTIAGVSIWGPNIRPFTILRDKNGDLFLIQSDYGLIPIAEAAVSIKRHAR